MKEKNIGLIGPSVEENEMFLSNIVSEGKSNYRHITNVYDVMGRTFDEIIEHPSAKRNPHYKAIKQAIEDKTPRIVPQKEIVDLSLVFVARKVEDAVRDYNKHLIDINQSGLRDQDAKKWAKDWIAKNIK